MKIKSPSKTAAGFLVQLLGTCLGLVFLGGCSSMLPEIVPFGAVSGADATRSINGLGVHKKMWESAGAKCLTPKKLSPKLDSLDVIVLVGQSYGPPGVMARDWLEQWLSERSGRTVVYFGRDFNANLYYRQQTLVDLEPDEQARGAQELALAQVQEMKLRLRQLPESTFGRWFYMDTTLPRREHTAFSGPWADALAGKSGSWPVGVALQPPEQKWRSQKPSWLTKNKGANALQPASQWEEPVDEEGTIRRSTWDFNELSTTEDWNSEFRQVSKPRVLLAGDDGQPLVYRLSSARYSKSQILIVTNGAPLLNGSLVDPLHRVIGKQLIEECLPAKRVGLIAYDDSGLLIAETPEADARAAGLEMLTVWPLSAITMPAALLGILICAVLLPILGRPQMLPRRSVTDFGLHIEALGRMLSVARDDEYATKAISDYFRQVRKEPPPYWLQSVGPPASPATQSDSPAESNPKEGATSNSPSPIQSASAPEDR